MPDEIVLAGIAAAGYAAQKVLGPTLETMGQDMNKVWAIGKKKIFDRAAAKTKNLEDGKTANLRVTRDVIWNGAVTDDEVCAEYFGGILAACRSEDGKDDSSIQFVDCIKAMSARQLHLHYSIYNAWQRLLIESGKNINVAQSREVDSCPIWFSTNELVQRLKLNPGDDLTILHRQGLLSAFEAQAFAQGGRNLPYVTVTPTTFGVMLYAVALNRLDDWRKFSTEVFGTNPEILVPEHYTLGLDAMIIKAGMSPLG